jgi:excisionase family DNA binding protein
MPNKKEQLKVEEVAKRLDVDERTIYRYIESGELKAVKIGGWRIAEDDLEKFIVSRRNKPKKTKKK